MSLPPLTPDQQVKPARFETRMSLAFGTLFLATGVQVPYFPVWLEGKGFGPNDIAIILSLPMFLRVFTTPVITTLADKAGDRANVLTLLVGASAFLSLGYFLPPTYAIVLLVSLLLQIVWTPHSPLADFGRPLRCAALRLQLHQDAHLGLDLLSVGQSVRRHHSFQNRL